MEGTFLNERNKGISLITLVVTIMIMIILAAFVFYSQFKSMETAEYAKFVQEFGEVQKSVETVRLSNAKYSMQSMNNGFKKVSVSGEIPDDFTTIVEGKKQAYLVDLNFIGCSALLTGKEYKNYEPEGDNLKTVIFGKDDVFVYDAKGQLYYVRGFFNNNDDKVYYKAGS